MFFRKYYHGILLIGLFVFTYVLTSLYPVNSDMWFHLASGRVFAEKGIIHYDLLSQAGPTRQLVPYEWLFDSILYSFTSIFGFSSYKVFVGGIAIIHIAILYLLLRKIFQTNRIFSIAVCVFYFLLVSSFFVGRPQIVADTFFLLEVYILLLYLVKNKNVLLLLLPLAYIWGTFHPSVVLGIGFEFIYIVTTAILFVATKGTDWLRKTKYLALVFVGMCLLSVLPPEGLMGYQYILIIKDYAQLFSRYVIEWFPLTVLLADGLLYSLMTIPFLIALLYVLYKKKKYSELVWLSPILLLIPYGFTALRNTYFGYAGISIITGWTISHISFRHNKLRSIVLLIIGGVVIYGVLILATLNRLSGINSDYPQKAVTFMRQHTLTGNMFNQYNIGGYLSYQLYPQYKVFIDGRTDLFLCCELPGYFSLQDSISLPDKPFAKLLYNYFAKYHISYAVLEIRKDPLGARISEILSEDTQWVLVYWDDGHDIFVKKRTNKAIVDAFGVTAASPFSPNPVKANQFEQARKEYLRMIHMSDSAVSRNALGYIYFLEGSIPQAKIQFEKAIALDSTYESGYSNLAEIMVKEKDYPNAIILYTKAISLNPNRPILYIRLGQLYEAIQDKANAQSIWQQGLTHSGDGQYKQILNQLLGSISH